MDKNKRKYGHHKTQQISNEIGGKIIKQTKQTKLENRDIYKRMQKENLTKKVN